MVSIAFSAPFFLPASRLQALDLSLLCLFKGAQLFNYTQLNHLFYSGITADVGKPVEIYKKLVEFYEAWSWYWIWKTRLMLLFEMRLWKIRNCCMCSKPSSLQLMCKFDWLAAEIQCALSPFTFSLHT